MQDFKVETRDELQDGYRVFYVTAWGYAGDHLFGWFPKALNCHRDVYALLAHEGSRPKYLKERTRGERPPLVPFTEFLNDMGMTYAAIGDCYSYRAGQMPELLALDRYGNIPVANLLRHPVPWLEFYVRWRASNMRMRAGATDPLTWEWKTAHHALFRQLGLPDYDKDDIETWACFQGMTQLNHVVGDLKAALRQVPIERIADDPTAFRELAEFLCRNQAIFDQATLDSAFSMRYTLFRGEAPVECEPDRLMQSWPGWKVDAFRKIVSPEALLAYASFGYALGDLAKRPHAMPSPGGNAARPIFVSSVPKSGTWLLREILEMMTGLKGIEPEIGLGGPAYDDEMAIEFRPGTFFSWHTIVTARTASLLRSCQSRNIFLIRNIYDVLLSMFNHLSRDVDASIDRSVVGSDYFRDKPVEQCLSLMIAGFTSPQLTWLGVGPLLRQVDSLLDMAESGEALLLDYEALTGSKRRSILRIMRYLEYRLPAKRIREITAATERPAMRKRLRSSGRDAHITTPEQALSRSAFLPYHKDMLDLAVMAHAPRLPERLRALGLDMILHLEEETQAGSGGFVSRLFSLLGPR